MYANPIVIGSDQRLMTVPATTVDRGLIGTVDPQMLVWTKEIRITVVDGVLTFHQAPDELRHRFHHFHKGKRSKRGNPFRHRPH
jgi:hypothetical protein